MYWVFNLIVNLILVFNVLQSSDFFMVPFVYNSQRGQVLDFPFMLSCESTVTILSSPQLESIKGIEYLFNYFDRISWILLFFSFLIIISIKSNEKNSFKEKIFLIIDYFGLSLGRGLPLKQFSKHWNNCLIFSNDSDGRHEKSFNCFVDFVDFYSYGVLSKQNFFVYSQQKRGLYLNNGWIGERNSTQTNGSEGH